MARTNGNEDLRRRLGTLVSRAMGAVGEAKDAVVRSSQKGKIKLDAAFLRRERDAAARLLGEEIFRLVEEGRLELPAELEAGVAAIRDFDAKIAVQEAELASVEAEAAGWRQVLLEDAKRAEEVEMALADGKYEVWSEGGEAAESPPEKKIAGS